MKKIILIALLITCMLHAVKAQFSLQASAGIESSQSAYIAFQDSSLSKYTVAYKNTLLGAGDLSLAYTLFKRIEPAAFLNFSGLQHGSANFGGRISYIIGDVEDESGFMIIPFAGYTYNFKSSDKTEFTVADNYFEFLYGLKIQKGIVFGQVNYFNTPREDKFQIMVGLKFQ